MGFPLAWSWHVCRVALALPFPLGPPCMEAFLNKPHASSPVACPVSCCVKWVVLGGAQSQTGHPPAHRGAESPTRRVSMGEIRGGMGQLMGGWGQTHVAVMWSQ